MVSSPAAQAPVDLSELLQLAPDAIAERTADMHASDLAEGLKALEPAQGLIVFQALDLARAAKVLVVCTSELRVSLLSAIEPTTAAAVIAHMSADDQTDTLQTLPKERAESILSLWQRDRPDAAAKIRELLTYPEDSAGGLMTIEFVAMNQSLAVAETMSALRQLGERGKAETVYAIYVVNELNQLVGVVSLRDLILAHQDQPLSLIMTENIVTVKPLADQEEVATLIAKYNISVVPVVNDAGFMLGVVTVDDVVDVVIEEATEDVQLLGAVEPTALPYFDTGFFTFIRKRVLWLVILFLGELFTANVMEAYHSDIIGAVDLAIFIPLIISSGGNSGSQSSSLIIRAIALGELAPSDWGRVVIRELGVGLALGIVLGVVGFVRVWLGLSEGSTEVWALALAVSLSLVAVVLLGTMVGSLLPLLMKRMGLDPAVSSTPFIASLVDVVGLIVYFSISRSILVMTDS